MGRFVNTFSWSISRAEKLRACPKAYYFHYYGSWGGWEREATARTRELWLLKKLTSRWAWAGTAVHDTIAWALAEARDRGTLPAVQSAVERMQTRMRKEFLESRAGTWRFRRALGLTEHAYDEEVEDEEWRDNWEHARRCLESFFEAPVKAEILSVPTSNWLPIDSLDSFLLDGVTVYVAPDFAFRDDSGRLRILDWKTGAPKDSDLKQIRGYALFAREKWSASPAEIVGEIHYLRDSDFSRVDVDNEALEGFRDEIRSSMAKMRSLLADPEGNIANEDAFDPTGNKSVCSRCNFRGVCDFSS